MNNCGEPLHRQVIDNGLLPILVKIVKEKVASFFLAEYWIMIVKLLLVIGILVSDRITSLFARCLPKHPLVELNQNSLSTMMHTTSWR